MHRPAPKPRKRPASGQQDWGMLIFESLSAGGIAVLLAMAATLVLVGIYTYFVWTFTNWDLAGVKLEKFGSYALLSIFALGTGAGFWCFSGAAFREKGSPRRQSSVLRPK